MRDTAMSLLAYQTQRIARQKTSSCCLLGPEPSQPQRKTAPRPFLVSRCHHNPGNDLHTTSTQQSLAASKLANQLVFIQRKLSFVGEVSPAGRRITTAPAQQAMRFESFLPPNMDLRSVGVAPPAHLGRWLNL
jgi:hypothetical protein